MKSYKLRACSRTRWRATCVCCSASKPESLVNRLGAICLACRSQVKTGALTLLSELCRVAPEEMARNLPTTVPALTAAMADAKRQVQVRRPVLSAH